MRVKTCEVGGRTFDYQGYEDIALEEAARRYGVKSIVSQYDPAYESLRIDDTYFRPDFYVKGKFYVEVKSTWTLLRYWDLNTLKAKLCEREGIKIVWLVCESKERRCHKLPPLWFRSKSQTISWLKESGLKV